MLIYCCYIWIIYIYKEFHSKTRYAIIFTNLILAVGRFEYIQERVIVEVVIFALCTNNTSYLVISNKYMNMGLFLKYVTFFEDNWYPQLFFPNSSEDVPTYPFNWTFIWLHYCLNYAYIHILFLEINKYIINSIIMII